MPLSLDDLDLHLFKCADIIRDAVDPTDYKEYILPLVYYKSISDEFETQYAENVEEYGEDFARRQNLYDIPVVPEGYLCKDLRAVSDNVDLALNEAFEALTEENPELKGLFRADYIDADALNDDRLGKLVEHLTTCDLNRDSVPPDMLGEAYMDLVRHFAEEEGNRADSSSRRRISSTSAFGSSTSSRTAWGSTTPPWAPAACSSRPRGTTARSESHFLSTPFRFQSSLRL